MLKKLLASALAVATVASCAYIPSALASADTTYKTATEVEYLDYKLDNPTAPDTLVDVTVYVGSNAQAKNLTGTAKFSVKASESSADEVKATFTDKLKNGKFNTLDATTIDATSDAATRYNLVYFAPAGNNTYVAQITEEVAVVYSTFNSTVVNVPNTKPETLAANQVELLGYYATGNALSSTVLADMWSKNLAAKAQMANEVFERWQFNAVSDAAQYVAPMYNGAVEGGRHYTKVDVAYLNSGVVVENAYIRDVATGLYYKVNEISPKEIHTNVLVPTDDSANWNVYLTNFLRKNQVVACNGNYFVKDSDGNAKAYDFDRVRLVKAATSDANAVYAATYKLSKENVNNNVQYNLWLVEEGSQGVAITVPGKEQAAWTGHYLTKDQYITDPAKIYEMMFDADINDYLTAAKDSDNVVWKLTGKFAQVETNSRDKYVNVTAIVERAEKYTVYSFGANNSVVESYAWLTDKQVENTAYSNQDYTGNLAKPEEVIKATAADLGVAEVASVDGAQAKYAYAKVYGNVIECTYKLGDATAELADFATTTGAFNAEAYFGRDAKANDKVLLKVSLSAQGEAKGLDASKISVEWNTYGTKAAGDAFFFEATEAYKAGAAQSFVLTEGTAVVTATVSYNGKVIGTFAPFYATVA